MAARWFMVTMHRFSGHTYTPATHPMHCVVAEQVGPYKLFTWIILAHKMSFTLKQLLFGNCGWDAACPKDYFNFKDFIDNVSKLSDCTLCVCVCVAQLLTASMELISQMRLRSWSMICFRCWFFCFNFCRKNIEKRGEKTCFRYKNNNNYKCASSLVTEKKACLKSVKTTKQLYVHTNNYRFVCSYYPQQHKHSWFIPFPITL